MNSSVAADVVDADGPKPNNTTNTNTNTSAYNNANFDDTNTNCKNPEGVEGQVTLLSSMGSSVVTKSSPSLLMLTVSPGRLGLTLSMTSQDEVGGAVITNIDPACKFLNQIEVGDRIFTIDGKRVVSLNDVINGNERERKFGILKKPVATAAMIPVPSMTPDCDVDDPCNDKENIGNNPSRKNDGRMQTYPLLSILNANTTERPSEHIRENLMTELLHWDKKHNIDARVGQTRYQVLCVPLKLRDNTTRELDTRFHNYNKQTKLFDKFLGAWASFCDGTQADAANMILRYMAKRFPQLYLQNVEVATNAHITKQELPPDFVSYDGTKDVKWNTKYGELIVYQKENGDCQVNTSTDLGKWVSYQRCTRTYKVKALTDTRIQLLDALGFVWCARPSWTAPIPTGDPRQNRAMAAKLVFPELLVREVLYLGGFEDEELDAVRDTTSKYTWRTGYVHWKDKIVQQLQEYETGKRIFARAEIDHHIATLHGDDEDRFEQVFKEKFLLLPVFLEAAEERRKNGIVETFTKRNTKRRLERESLLEAQAGVTVDDEEGESSDVDDDTIENKNENVNDDNDNDDDDGEMVEDDDDSM